MDMQEDMQETRNYEICPLGRDEGWLAQWESGEIEGHPYAQAFPMHTHEEASRLKEAIERDGYDRDEPIVLFQGLILDGRNRAWRSHEVYTQTGDAETRPYFAEFRGTEVAALAYVSRKNLALRQLTPTQHALVAAKFFEAFKRARSTSPPRGGTGWLFDREDPTRQLQGSSAVLAAALVPGAKARTIERVDFVKREGPKVLGGERAGELIEAMDRGELGAKRAEQIVRDAMREPDAPDQNVPDPEQRSGQTSLLEQGLDDGPDEDERLIETDDVEVRVGDGLEIFERCRGKSASTILLRLPDLQSWDWTEWHRLDQAMRAAIAPGGHVWVLTHDPQIFDEFAVSQRIDAHLVWQAPTPTDQWSTRLVFIFLLNLHDGRDIDCEVTLAPPAWERLQALAGTARVLEVERDSSDRSLYEGIQDVPRRLLEALLAASPEGLVLDPFAGSGEVVLVCRELGRRVMAVIDPAQEEVAREVLAEIIERPPGSGSRPSFTVVSETERDQVMWFVANMERDWPDEPVSLFDESWIKAARMLIDAGHLEFVGEGEFAGHSELRVRSTAAGRVWIEQNPEPKPEGETVEMFPKDAREVLAEKVSAKEPASTAKTTKKKTTKKKTTKKKTTKVAAKLANGGAP